MAETGTPAEGVREIEIASAEQRLVRQQHTRIRRELRGVHVLEQAAEWVPGHEPREQEVDRQRDPDREDVEEETADEPAHVPRLERNRRAERRPVGGAALRPPVGRARCYFPALPPGQMVVNRRMLSGLVVKIGSA